MGKSILLSINIDKDNTLKYMTAMQLAKEKNSNLVLFVVLPNQCSEAELDHAYLHLLQLQGFYQSQCDGWETGQNVNIKRVVQHGDLTEQLHLFLQKSSVHTVLF